MHVAETAVGLELVEHLVATAVGLDRAVLDDGLHEALLGGEVVLDHCGVALARGLRDLAERDGVDAVPAVEILGRGDEQYRSVPLGHGGRIRCPRPPEDSYLNLERLHVQHLRWQETARQSPGERIEPEAGADLGAPQRGQRLRRHPARGHLAAAAPR